MFFVALGFDCDVPRGADYVKTDVGKQELAKTLDGLRLIREGCRDVPLTYFICGSFLETMVSCMGLENTRGLFLSEAEIGNHSWSHSVVAPVKLRSDKKPLTPEETESELKRTNLYLKDVFGGKVLGFRTPLGHSSGLKAFPEVVNVIKKTGFRYVSSDLRSEEGTLNPPLRDRDIARQPYYYFNGLLEIPSHGWQDTAFSGKSKTPSITCPPRTPEEIFVYYRRIIERAALLGNGFFLCFVMHPFALADYARNGFFDTIKKIVLDLDGNFVKYGGIGDERG